MINPLKKILGTSENLKSLRWTWFRNAHLPPISSPAPALRIFGFIGALKIIPESEFAKSNHVKYVFSEQVNGGGGQNQAYAE